MAGQFGVTVDELRRVAGQLQEVSSAMKRVMSTLESQLAAAGPAWGGGEMGNGFADGPSGYLPQLDWVEGSVQAKTGLLDYYAALLSQAANAFEQSDNSGTYSPMVGNATGSGAGNRTGSGAGNGTGNGSGGGTGPLGGGPASSSPNPTAGPAPANALPGVGSGDLPADGAGVGPSANGSGSPTTPASPSGGRGSGSPSGDGSPEAPSSPGGTPSQKDGSGQDPGSGDATHGAPVSGDVPGDGASAGVDAKDGESLRPSFSPPEAGLDSSTTSPNAGPFTAGATPAPLNPPSLPKLPTQPNRKKPSPADEPESPAPPSGQKPRPADEPEPPPPSTPKDRRPSTAAQADLSRQQHTGSGRAAGGRAGGAGAIVGGEGVPRTRRGRRDSERRSGIADDLVDDADASGLVAGHPAGDRDGDDGDSHSGDERGLGDDSPIGSYADDDELKGTVPRTV